MGTRAFVTGAIMGAGAMYFFDPRMGSRRRIAIEDRMRRISRRAAEGIDAGLRDLENRGQGLKHGVGSLFESPRQWTGGREDNLQQRSSSGPSLKWSPGPRLIAASIGTALMANCMARRTPAAVILGTLGFGLFNRALTGPRGGIEVQKTLEINAPVDRVFEFFSHPENYMRVSDVVTHVEVFGDGRFAKDMLIAGMPVHFEERIVRCEKDQVLASRSEPRSALRFCKQMCFERMDDDRTRVHLHFTYHPLGGILGHATATMFGFDPKTVLTDLLMRARFFLETGREPRDAICHRRHRTRQHEGDNRQQRREEQNPPSASSAMHGPGAPTEDVHRPGMPVEQSAIWPPSGGPIPQPTETAGHFPPAV
jgi:uncharacterized membrane protein